MTPLRARLTALTLTALATVQACAHRQPETIDEGARAAQLDVRSSSELGLECPRLSLYEALRALRGEPIGWRMQLDSGDRNGPLPILYVNRTRVMTTEPGGVSRRLPCASVRKVELVPGNLAVSRYGKGHEAGAILVTTDSSLSHPRRRTVGLIP